MSRFVEILRQAYGTEDDMHYIVPRLSDNDLMQCVNDYARECCQESLNVAAVNALMVYRPNVYGHYDIKHESITNPENIVLV